MFGMRRHTEQSDESPVHVVVVQLQCHLAKATLTSCLGFFLVKCHSNICMIAHASHLSNLVEDSSSCSGSTTVMPPCENNHNILLVF